MRLISGSVKVVLQNHSEDVLHVSVGQRVAQLVVAPLVAVVPVECDDVAGRDTARGADGFGSSGAVQMKRRERVCNDKLRK